ncbi:MAG: GNAT family N-acetyltransferase [Chloroflexi bacterium]|nr:GNAT family N-acetyltransferase [Chloroflexota bacterium]
MGRVEIEAANPNDHAFLAEMVALSFRSLPHLASKSNLEIETMARLEVAGWEPGRDLAFIAQANHQRVGAIWLRADGELSAQHFVLSLAVAQAFQHRGVGTKLIEYVLDYCKRNGGVSMGLKVYPGNLPAMRLYRRFGFEDVTLELRKKL